MLITKAGLWLRGVEPQRRVARRHPGQGPAARTPTADQDLGPKDSEGNPTGRNGIVVYKVSGVSIENLSACNFLGGENTPGDQIWFDGGGSSGKQTTESFRGDYLTATSTYYAGSSAPSAAYGIYSSNTAGGPRVFYRDYASNMNDSDFYVGACPACGVIVDAVHGVDSAEGYSGTNSGDVVIENSEFDHNRDGFDTNSQNNDDAPSPQEGTCPHDGVNPHPPTKTQRIHSCWVFEDNYVHDNNNPNVPAAGVEYNIPTGTGLSIYGGRHDIVTHNRFVNNGAWGILLAPEPDMETPPPGIGEHCQGGSNLIIDGEGVCYFDDYGSEIANNTFTHDGYLGNNGNADIAEISGHTPDSSTDGNCFHDNRDTSGKLTSQPGNIDSYRKCGADLHALAGPASRDRWCAPHPTCRLPVMARRQLPPDDPRRPAHAAGAALDAQPVRGRPRDPWCSGQITTVKACTHGAFRARAPLAPSERLVRFSARIIGASGTWSARGALISGGAPRSTSRPLPGPVHRGHLGARSPRVVQLHPRPIAPAECDGSAPRT